MASLIFGRDKVEPYVRCISCDEKKRPIKRENAHFVTEWLNPLSTPVVHVFCKKHYAEYIKDVDGRQAGLLENVPCSNTGVALDSNEGQETKGKRIFYGGSQYVSTIIGGTRE